MSKQVSKSQQATYKDLAINGRAKYIAGKPRKEDFLGRSTHLQDLLAKFLCFPSLQVPTRDLPADSVYCYVLLNAFILELNCRGKKIQIQQCLPDAVSPA